MIEGSCHCGAVRWRLAETPHSATACNCTICRRYGTLWAYGYEGAGVELSGVTESYVRADGNQTFNFCPRCGCVGWWRALEPEEGGHRVGVNLRLAEPEAVAAIPVKHLDGLVSWHGHHDGRRVSDMWF